MNIRLQARARSSSQTMLSFCSLSSCRSLITLTGADASSFLQGLISLDVRKLVANSNLLSGAFLNPKGRILHQVFVAKQNDQSFDIETDSNQAENLISMLNKFKLRKKVVVQFDEQKRNVFAVWGGEAASNNTPYFYPDPRPGMGMGHRVWTTMDFMNNNSSSTMREISLNVYNQIRIANGLIEGNVDCMDEVPFQFNFDWWEGSLAYDKGCYTGQELIARTHFKGQVRKRIAPVLLSTNESSSLSSSLEDNLLLPPYVSWEIKKPTSNELPPIGATITPINENGPVGEGTLISLAPGRSNLGLATFRDAANISMPESFQPSHQIKLESGQTIQICPIRPNWWPKS